MFSLSACVPPLAADSNVNRRAEIALSDQSRGTSCSITVRQLLCLVYSKFGAITKTGSIRSRRPRSDRPYFAAERPLLSNLSILCEAPAAAVRRQGRQSCQSCAPLWRHTVRAMQSDPKLTSPRRSCGQARISRLRIRVRYYDATHKE